MRYIHIISVLQTCARLLKTKKEWKEQVASGNTVATHNVQSMWPCDSMLLPNSKAVLCHRGLKRMQTHTWKQTGWQDFCFCVVITNELVCQKSAVDTICYWSQNTCRNSSKKIVAALLWHHFTVFSFSILNSKWWVLLKWHIFPQRSSEKSHSPLMCWLLALLSQ